MNENKPADDAHAPRRRRVLRGAISAPVVLTISSGAGAQMTSSLRCVANQVQNPTTLPREVLSGGSVPSTVVRVQLRQAGSIFYVAGSDVIALQQMSRPISWIGVGEYRQFKASRKKQKAHDREMEGNMVAIEGYLNRLTALGEAGAASLMGGDGGGR